MTTKKATCPSCQHTGQFHAAGVQQWPRAVAAAHNLPSEIRLWTCPHCHTTISEIDLPPASTLPAINPAHA